MNFIKWYFYLLKLKITAILHGLYPNKHKWEYIDSANCGCCGGHRMICEACNTRIPLDKTVTAIWDKLNEKL